MRSLQALRAAYFDTQVTAKMALDAYDAGGGEEEEEKLFDKAYLVLPRPIPFKEFLAFLVREHQYPKCDDMIGEVAYCARVAVEQVFLAQCSREELILLGQKEVDAAIDDLRKEIEKKRGEIKQLMKAPDMQYYAGQFCLNAWWEEYE